MVKLKKYFLLPKTWAIVACVIIALYLTILPWDPVEGLTVISQCVVIVMLSILEVRKISFDTEGVPFWFFVFFMEVTLLNALTKYFTHQ